MSCTTSRIPDFNGGDHHYHTTTDFSEQTCDQSCRLDTRCDAYSFIPRAMQGNRCHLFMRGAVQETADVGSVLVYLNCEYGKFINLFSCSTQLSMKYKPLLNIRIAKIIGIFRF